MEAQEEKKEVEATKPVENKDWADMSDGEGDNENEGEKEVETKKERTKIVRQ
jgi:hypothetical protein